MVGKSFDLFRGGAVELSAEEVEELQGIDPSEVRVRFPENPQGPDEHKRLVRQIRGLSSVNELLVLGQGNDPFYFGTKADHKNANWLKRLWEKFGYTVGVHIRRIHYRADAVGEPMVNGSTYNKDDNRCWSAMGRANKAARALGMVDARHYTDRRTDPAQIFIEPRETPAEPEAKWDAPDWELPTIDPSEWLDEQIDFYLPDIKITGYDYQASDQPVLIEVWIEKSTMNDVLEPICQELGVNLVVGKGIESWTRAVNFLVHRAAKYGGRAHILYISDFDFAGVVMPFAVARHIQFYHEKYSIDVDVSIDVLALTLDQIRDLGLPRAPGKSTDKRQKNFEARYGVGVTELDALEAFYPGMLADMVRQTVAKYRDPTLNDRLRTVRQEVRSDVEPAWTDATEDLRADLSQLTSDVQPIIDRYREEFQEVANRMNIELAPYEQQLQELRDRVRDASEEVISELDLPERPQPELSDVDDSKLLFDSRRHWWDQLMIFKTRKKGVVDLDNDEDEEDNEG
jgi:hypothetical protein